MKRFQSQTDRIGRVATDVSRTIHSISGAGRVVAAAVLFVLMFYITADVCGRFFFRAPLRGTLEVSQIMLLVIIFFFIAYAQALKEHVAIELFSSRWSPRGQAILGVLYSAAAIGFFALMIKSAVTLGLTDLRGGVTTDQLGIPLFLVKLTIPVGAAAMILEILTDLVRYFRQSITGKQGAR